jgi:hypothetical protein
MSHRTLTTLLAAIAAIATTTAVAMAATSAGPQARTAANIAVYRYISIGRFMTAGTHVHTVHCARGKKVVGGGVRLYGTHGVIAGSSPLDGGEEGWRGAVYVAPSTHTDIQLQVHAVCVEIF